MIDKRFKYILSRRRFFTGALRYTSLGLLCAAAGLLIAKRYRLMRQGICINEGLCKGCGVLDSCRLPLALSAKRVGNTENDG